MVFMVCELYAYPSDSKKTTQWFDSLQMTLNAAKASMKGQRVSTIWNVCVCVYYYIR